MGSYNDTPSGKSRWAYSQETVVQVAAKFHEIDPDGMTLYTFSNNPQRYDNITAEKATALLNRTEPSGSTNLAGVLQDAFDNYFNRRAKGKSQPNGEYLMVVTDGEPDDQEAVARVIVAATKKVTSANELTLTFVQVGQDPKATAFLAKLDDDLEKLGAKYDIVDTIPISAMGDRNLTDVLITAVSEHKHSK